MLQLWGPRPLFPRVCPAQESKNRQPANVATGVPCAVGADTPAADDTAAAGADSTSEQSTGYSVDAVWSRQFGFGKLDRTSARGETGVRREFTPVVGDQPEVTTVATPGEMEDVMGWDSQLIERLILVYKHVRHKNRGEVTIGIQLTRYPVDGGAVGK